MVFFGGVKKDAQFAFGARYRLWLSREWDATLPKALFIMLNPSTADARLDDPTIRKDMGFARRWGLGGIFVVNLFDLRTPKPEVLLKAEDPISILNDSAIIGALLDAKEKHWTVVCAWGNHGTFKGRGGVVCRHLSRHKITGYSLGALTKEGQPQHPLYVPYETKLERFVG